MTDDGLTPYQQRRAASPRPSRSGRRLSDNQKRVAIERQREKSRRRQEAIRRTGLVFLDRYPDEWVSVFSTELAGVDRERGPLPEVPERP